MPYPATHALSIAPAPAQPAVAGRFPIAQVIGFLPATTSRPAVAGRYPIAHLLGFFPVAGTTPVDPGELPYDLAEAIVERFEEQAGTTLAGFSKIYRDQAGTNPSAPYLIYEISRGSLIYQSSTSTWHDDRVSFRAWSDTGEIANLLADTVRVAFDGQTFSFQRGVTSPLVEVDRGQGKASGRTKNATNLFWASVEYSANTRSGRPT